jgi:Bor protein
MTMPGETYPIQEEYMPRSVRAAAAAIAIITLQGCYHTRLLTNGPPATDYRSQTVHQMWWGLVQPNIVPDNCPSDAVQEVRVTSNLGYSLLTVLSLGIWSPVEVEWRCAKNPSPPPPSEQ